MKSLCVVTIKLNTLRDVLYQMTVGGAFVYVCEKPVKEAALEILNNSRVYITRGFSCGPRRPCYNGVAV